MSGISFHSLGDDALIAAWTELAEVTSASPFMRPGWFQAWARAFGRGVEVATAGAGTLEALAPVLRRPGGTTSAINQETPDYSLVAHGGLARGRLLQELITHGSTELLKVGREDADAVHAVSGSRRVIEEVMQRSPFIEVAGGADTYESSLRSKFVKDIKRRARRMSEEGEFKIEVHDGRERLRELLREAFEVESSQWKEREGTAIASRPATRSFYEEIAAWTAENGWLRLWFLRFDGRAIAFAFDLAAAEVYYGLKVGYDPGYARFSPGLLLQHDTVRYAFDHGLKRFEFLGADEPYKLNWTKSCRDRLAVRVFAPGARGTAAWFNRAVARPALKRLSAAATLNRRKR